jgi:signal transduction histidine kinase
VLVNVTLVAGLSLAAVLAVTSRLVTHYALNRSRSDLEAARDAFRELVESRTQHAATEARLVAELPVLQSLLPLASPTDTATMDESTTRYCRMLGADFCVVTNAGGAWIGRAGDRVSAKESPLASAIAETAAGRRFAGIFSSEGALFLTVSEPAWFGAGPEVLGTFTVGYRLDDDVATELARMARCDVTFVCAGDRVCGTSLGGGARDALGRAIGSPALAGLDAAPSLRDIGETSYVAGLHPLGSNGARLLLLQDWSPTAGILADLHRALLWVGVVTFGLAIGGMLFVGRRFTRPLRDLASAANELAGGNWTRRVDVGGPAEARVMAEAFNQMTVALRQREDQLRQAQKMEAVGRLAGGVAHDFNNLLTGILGYADLVLRELPPDHPNRDDIEGIRRAGRSASALTRELLAFSRKQVLQPVVMDLNDVVTGTENLMRRLLGEDIQLELRLAANLDQVRADRAQIEQVLMNLAVNARDAMPGGGRLTIETDNVLADRSDIADHLGGAEGRHVLLRVSDTGHGMTPAVLAHLFEPFFTTKEVGKGTGLGLSTVYGVVKQSAGFIWADSAPGRGAAFSIVLPAVEGAAAPAVAFDRPEVAPRGSETVLLVEDNDSVRSLARDTLRRFGYQVLEARNGEEALRVARAQLDRISLLLTDLVMPFMGGRELARQLGRERRDLKVIFTSGYAADTLGPQAVLEPGAVFIQKPFTPTALGQTVRDVLDRPQR